MQKRKLNQRGLITMELIILIVLAMVIYFIYKRIQAAQS
jgi:preprotein translocase subunit YajC